MCSPTPFGISHRLLQPIAGNWVEHLIVVRTQFHCTVEVYSTSNRFIEVQVT